MEYNTTFRFPRLYEIILLTKVTLERCKSVFKPQKNLHKFTTIHKFYARVSKKMSTNIKIMAQMFS